MELNHLHFQPKIQSILAVLGIEPRLKRVGIKIPVKELHNVTCYHYTTPPGPQGGICFCFCF